MISFKKQHEDISIEISSSYEIDCDIYEISFPKPIYCATLKFSDVEKLERQWMGVNKALSISISEKFANDFQKWNFYIIYFCDFEIKKELKYKVENDKSYSRKITINNSHIKGRSVCDIFEEEVIFTDIGLKIETIKKSQELKQSYSSDIISLIPTDSIKNEELKELYQAISEKLETSSEA